MNLREQLIRDEGLIEHCYFDSLGYATIGVGHLIDERRGGKLPDHIIQQLLDYDIAEHKRDLLDALPWVASLDDARQGVLINMYFNLGPGLLKFVTTLALIKNGDYKDAAAAMLQSKWASQVGPRAKRLATQMETGKWV